MWRYLVVYAGSMVGNCVWERAEPITTYDDVRGLEAAIADRNGFDQVILTNLVVLAQPDAEINV